MELDYDDTVGCLRDALTDAARNVRAFGLRARGKPELLSSHGWGELAEIESLLSALLEDVLRREMRVEPWSMVRQMRSGYGGALDGLRGERALVQRLASEAASYPVDVWRAGAPQLEATLWPFFSARTHYLANTLALALNEPAPYPPLVWNRARRSFS